MKPLEDHYKASRRSPNSPVSSPSTPALSTLCPPAILNYLKFPGYATSLGPRPRCSLHLDCPPQVVHQANTFFPTLSSNWCLSYVCPTCPHRLGKHGCPSCKTHHTGDTEVNLLCRSYQMSLSRYQTANFRKARTEPFVFPLTLPNLAQRPVPSTPSMNVG